jgi:site-specific recombinase XerD
VAEKKDMKLAPFVRQFLVNYLPHIKGASPYTVKTYRDAFKLFLPFAAHYHGIKIKSLRVEHISSELILAFLNALEKERKNQPNTRNQRLAALKSFAKMLRFISPENRDVAERILHIPQKRAQKPLIGFLYPQEILKVFHTVDLRKTDGLRDYTILHLLSDSGARATELATLKLDYFNPQQHTLAILGKGNRFRLIELELKTTQLLTLYIKKYRKTPKPLYRQYLFINQRGEPLTRHGIYRICRKYLSRALPAKRLQHINPVHSFRHSCAVDMLLSGHALTDIRNRLGHDNIQSTTIYLHLDLNCRRQIQNQLIKHMHSALTTDPKIEELLHWEGEQDIMAWLDSL